jgi:hypothetical protein
MTPIRASIVGPPLLSAFGDQDQDFNGSLPLLDLLFGLRQFLDIPGGILEGDELAAAGQRYRFFELALPTPAAQPFLSNSVLKLFGIRGAE